MKTITLKKQLLLVALIFFCGVAPSFADDDTSMTLNVEAGTLSSLIPASKMYKITELKLSGELNVEDLKVIRRMGACRKSSKDEWYDGHLQHLDISDAEFVGDGMFVYYYNNSPTTQTVSFTDRKYLFAGMKSLQTIELPNSMKEIDGSLFWECSSLVSLTLPSELTSIGVSSLRDCPNLMSIKIDKNNPYYCSDGAILFNKDKSKIILAKKTLDAYSIPSSVTQIQSYAFAGCNSLVYLTLPSGVTLIGKSAFYGCSSLRSLTLPSGVTQIGDWAFFGCSSLESLTLPSGVTQIGESAFSGCSSLKSLTLPSSVTQIGERAFFRCSSLRSLTLPSGVTQIGNYAFCRCSSLYSLTLPSGVTQIGNSAFYGCSSLASLTLPSSLREISVDAFLECENIETIYSYMPDPLPLYFEKNVMDKAILYVPKGSYQNYVLADYWKEFNNIKEFDSETAGINNTHSADKAKELSRYAVNGQRLATPAKGLNIVRYSDGTVKKVMEK